LQRFLLQLVYAGIVPIPLVFKLGLVQWTNCNSHVPNVENDHGLYHRSQRQGRLHGANAAQATTKPKPLTDTVRRRLGPRNANGNFPNQGALANSLNVDPTTLAKAIDRDTGDTVKWVGRTKAQDLKAIKN